MGFQSSQCLVLQSIFASNDLQAKWLTDWLSSVISQTEMLYCTTLVGLPFLLPPMFLTNEIFKAWSDCYQVHITSHKLSFAIHFLLRIVCLFVCFLLYTFATLWDSKVDRHFFSSFQNVGTVSIHHIDLIPYHLEKSSQTITSWNWLRACFWHWMINVIYLPLLYTISWVCGEI
jgi:hypothetical protein